MQIEPSLVHSDRRTCWLIGYSLLKPAHARYRQPGGANANGLPPQNAAHVALSSPLTVGNFPSTTRSLLPIYLCHISQLLVYVLVDLKSRLYRGVGALNLVADSMLHPWASLGIQSQRVCA